MTSLVPAPRLIFLSKDYPDTYLTLNIKCGLCGAVSQDDYGWADTSTVEEVLAAMEYGNFEYDLFAGSILCPRCMERIKEEHCLRPHPVDNHLCMVYAGHEADGIDHECCHQHMFY